MAIKYEESIILGFYCCDHLGYGACLGIEVIFGRYSPWRDVMTAISIIIPARKESLDAKVFFGDKGDVHVWPGFTDNILPVTEKNTSLLRMVVNQHRLIDTSNDTEIRSALSDDHVFDNPTEFCGMIARMIMRQSSGKEGYLLTVSINIFYVRGVDNKVFPVICYWGPEMGKWAINAYPLDVDRWHVRYRPFSKSNG